MCIRDSCSGNVHLADEIVAGGWDATEPAITLELGGVPPTGTLPPTSEFQGASGLQQNSAACVSTSGSSSGGTASAETLLEGVSQSCCGGFSKEVGPWRGAAFRRREGSPVDTASHHSTGKQDLPDGGGCSGYKGAEQGGPPSECFSKRLKAAICRWCMMHIGWWRGKRASESAQADASQKPSFTFTKLL